MKRTKISKVKARPEYQQPQRFIDYVGASDFHSRFRLLVAALELLATEPASEDIGYAGVIDWLTEVAEKSEGEFMVLLQKAETADPGKHGGGKV